MLIRSIFDRIVLVAGLLLGAATAGFPGHFRQRMAGRLDQVSADLAAFHRIAVRHHDGDLSALINHHLNSTDATFREEGRAIQLMVDAEERLLRMFQALDSNAFAQMAAILRYGDPTDVLAALSLYQPSIVFSLDRILLSVLIGLLLWMAFLGIWSLSDRCLTYVRSGAFAEIVAGLATRLRVKLKLNR